MAWRGIAPGQHFASATRISQAELEIYDDIFAFCAFSVLQNAEITRKIPISVSSA